MQLKNILKSKRVALAVPATVEDYVRYANYVEELTTGTSNARCENEGL